MSEAAKPLTAERERLPNRRAHTLLNIEAGGFRYVAGVGHYDDGRLAEIFLNAEKGGAAIDGNGCCRRQPWRVTGDPETQTAT